jgi:acetyl-CoA/propionyl-CoA carboxylase biotin carboxyl carrier protein
VDEGAEISGLYDPMIAKLIVRGADREHARRRMLRALDEFVIEGTTTLLGFHRALLRHPCFVEGATCHGIVESELLAAQAAELSSPSSRKQQSVTRVVEEALGVEVDGRRYDVRLLRPEPPWSELARRRHERDAAGAAGSAGDVVVSPMQGTVLSVAVAVGDEVAAGQVVCVVEAMKMENEVHAHRAGVVSELGVAVGEPVKTGQVICVLAAP